jgi:hypothetical protein
MPLPGSTRRGPGKYNLTVGVGVPQYVPMYVGKGTLRSFLLSCHYIAMLSDGGERAPFLAQGRRTAGFIFFTSHSSNFQWQMSMTMTHGTHLCYVRVS